jgi:hypothetical protein
MPGLAPAVQWAIPANTPLLTRWAKEVSPTNALPDYPRPQMVRSDWLNLNGLWDYAIEPRAVIPDASGHHQNGNALGSPQWIAAGGPMGGCFQFDGENDSIAIPRVVQDDFTISLWLKTTQTGPEENNWPQGIGVVDGECPGVTDDFGTALLGDKFAFGVGNPDTTIKSTTPVNDGRWHEVAIVRTRATGVIQLFVDGKLEATAVAGTQSLSVPRRLTIGQIQTGDHYFCGRLADVRIYHHALSADEVAVLEQLPGKETAAAGSLAGWWPLNADWKQTQTAVNYTGKILAPYPVESALSGVMRPFLPEQKLWYRRIFRVPAAWRGRQILLHFDAVDYDATVWVNGQKMGEHKDGYDRFTFDITDVLKAGADQEVVLSVLDPTDEGQQAHGKQTLHPGGASYTATSGIWQTVWLEPVAAGGIADFKLIPDMDASLLRLTVRGRNANPQSKIEAIALADGREVASAKGGVGREIDLPIKHARLWSPDDPFLYDLKIKLTRNGKAVDEVGSYFGMRKISIGNDEKGFSRILLNGKFVFERGPLDQGFWPGGIYTAPTDDALKQDLEYCKQIGFNMVRKHAKVEPDRWYYWADKLGLLVWQDMPAGEHRTAATRAQWDMEMRQHIKNHFNSPSIVMWILFNEGWGEYDSARLVRMVRAEDPTRLISDASGWYDRKWGDIVDMHFYPGPGAPWLEEKRASVTGEFGGLGYITPRHMWDAYAWGYQSFTNIEQLTQEYERLWQRVYELKDDRGLSAAVYTQISDIEQEANGLQTYDRLEKMERDKVCAANLGKLPPLKYREIVPMSQVTPQIWRFTATNPPVGWDALNFANRDWSDGTGGFGSRYGMDGLVHTYWEGSELWLRHEFTVGPEGLHWPLLEMNYGADSDIYINGVLACRSEGFVNCYGRYELDPAARAAIKPGRNVLAVHLIDRHKGGEHFVDVGLLDEVESNQLNQTKAQ